MTSVTEQIVPQHDLAAPGEIGNGRCNCPYCQGESVFFLAAQDLNRQTTGETFSYFRCSRCGLVFMDPIPRDMSPYYKQGYQPIPANVHELRKIAASEKYRLDPILRHKRGGSLLEIGPWRGVFCCNAKDAGFEVSAIEMDKECVAFLNREVGIRAIQSYDPAATLHDLHEDFDVIALWHSLEHLPRPWEVIAEAAKRLKPGGLLLLAIPNIDSYEFSVLRERWRHLDAPRHLFFYPVSSLVAVCAANGLQELDLSTSDDVSRLLAGDTWETWSRRKFSNSLLRRVVRRFAFHFAHVRERTRKNSGPGMTAIFQFPEASGRSR